MKIIKLNNYYPFTIEKSGEKFRHGDDIYIVSLDNKIVDEAGDLIKDGELRKDEMHFNLHKKFSGNFMKKYKCSELSENVSIVIELGFMLIWHHVCDLNFFGLYRSGNKIYIGFDLGFYGGKKLLFKGDDYESLKIFLEKELNKDKTLIRDSTLSEYVKGFPFKKEDRIKEAFRKLGEYQRKKLQSALVKFEKKKQEDSKQYKKASKHLKEALSKTYQK